MRPTGAEVLARLGVRAPSIWVRSADSAFVGRTRELERLDRSFLALDRGCGTALFIHGPSGMGKTALIQRFLARVESRGALVLRGRCYERESLPFKALDSVVDALATYLRSLPPLAQQSLMPRRVRALARLFPALLQVPAIQAAPLEPAEPADPRELRRVAVSAFVNVLRRLSDQHRLVVAIDDLQWGDADSGDLIAELVEDLPPLMVLGSFQTDDRASSELLARVHQKNRHSFEEIELGPLDQAEARTLALRLVRPEAAGHADLIARESAGIPMFVHELVRHAAGPPLPLDEAISRRIAKLDPSALRILEVIATAGRPIDAELCNGVLGGEARRAIDTLRAAHLIRVRAGIHETGLETYHDLIRRSVLRGMATETVLDVHRRLALALEARCAPPDLLVHHWRAAGDPVRAGKHALDAARKASDALAFDRAVHMVRLAIELLDDAGGAGGSLYTALGDASANAGRAPEAARALLEAARRGAPDAVSLRSRAVQLLLTSGHVEPGLAELDRLLRSLGLAPLKGRRGLPRLVTRRLALRLGGARRRTPAVAAAPAELERIDACWSATTGLALIDMVLAADFHAENLARSARAGDLYRFARALGMEAVFLGVLGGRSTRRAQRILVECGALVAELDHAHLGGLLAAARGFVAMSRGRWAEMLAEGERAEQILIEQCTAVIWELDLARTLQLWGLSALGRFDELSSRASPLIAEADARGDRYATNMLRASPMVSLAWLAKDDPALAQSYLDDESRRWPKSHFLLQHYWSSRARAQIDLYRGDAIAAWENFEATWRVLVRSAFLRVAHLRLQARSLRARAALAAGVAAGDRALLAVAASEARRIAADAGDTAWATAIADRIVGLVALARGDPQTATARLLHSEALYEDLGMEVEVAASKRLRGRLLGGPEGAAMIDAADARMQRAGIANPAPFAGALTGWL